MFIQEKKDNLQTTFLEVTERSFLSKLPSVTTNDCLKALGIRDATCVVHYGFPSSPKLFGSRLFCMSEHFRNLSDMVPALISFVLYNFFFFGTFVNLIKI